MFDEIIFVLNISILHDDVRINTNLYISILHDDVRIIANLPNILWQCKLAPSQIINQCMHIPWYNTAVYCAYNNGIIFRSRRV